MLVEFKKNYLELPRLLFVAMLVQDHEIHYKSHMYVDDGYAYGTDGRDIRKSKTTLDPGWYAIKHKTRARLLIELIDVNYTYPDVSNIFDTDVNSLQTHASANTAASVFRTIARAHDNTQSYFSYHDFDRVLRHDVNQSWAVYVPEAWDKALIMDSTDGIMKTAIMPYKND